MNSAVGHNAPCWLCIEAPDFSTADADCKYPGQSFGVRFGAQTYPDGWIPVARAAKETHHCNHKLYSLMRAGKIESREYIPQNGKPSRLVNIDNIEAYFEAQDRERSA